MPSTPVCVAALSVAAAVSILGVDADVRPRPVPAPQNGEAAAAVNGLGGRLQVELADGGNLVFSPTSVAIALSMTSAGAAGDTLDEFRTALGMGDPATHEAMGALHETLIETGRDSLTLANSLWLQDGFAVAEPFEATLSDTYDAPPRQIDFAGDPAAATDEVNDWVSEATDQHIEELL